MPKLQDAKELIAPIEELVRELKSELNGTNGDFDRLVQLADELGEQADAVAEIFGSINETLRARIQELNGSGRQASPRRKAAVTS